MNAALETGVAGVGEMACARQPARPRQMVVAVLVAVAGLAAGVLTYRSLVTGPVSFGGQVVPAHVYALSFGETGTITAVKVHAGEYVTRGEVLATQNNSLAQADLQEAKDGEAAAAAALYADEHPKRSGVSGGNDSAGLSSRRSRQLPTSGSRSPSRHSSTLARLRSSGRQPTVRNGVTGWPVARSPAGTDARFT